jgi:hypothetical protein
VGNICPKLCATFTTIDKSVCKIFGNCPKISVSNTGKSDKTVSIINGNDEMQTHSIEFNKTYSITERIVYNLDAAIVMAFVYKILLELSFKFVNKNFKKKSNVK